MDLFEHHYYRLNKFLLELIGQWPYQSTRSSRCYLGVYLLLCITAVPPLILALVTFDDDWNNVIKSIYACLFVTIGVLKLLDMMWNPQKSLKLLNHIRTNWKVWSQDREINILHEYSEQGKKITFLYTDLLILLKGATYSAIIIYLTLPTIPKIIDVLLKNGTNLGKFPFGVDYYYFDEQKYYFPIMLHLYMSGCLFAIPFVVSDNMLITHVQHVCGIFASLGRKLELLGNSDTSIENDVHLRSFIDRHCDAIEYANLIEASYTWHFFYIVGVGVIMFYLVGLQIVMGTNDAESTIRYTAVLLALEMSFYIYCYLSQTLMDHSIDIHFYILNSQWYRLLPRHQKFLQLMIIRCDVPCQLTAGKILIMCVRNFVMAGRTAVSYFTIIRPK